MYLFILICFFFYVSLFVFSLFFNHEGDIEINGGGGHRVVVTPTVLHIQLVCTVATMHGLHPPMLKPKLILNISFFFKKI